MQFLRPTHRVLQTYMGKEFNVNGSVSFRGKWCKGQTDAYQKLYQAAEIRSRSAATRWTWMARRRASETFWLM